MCVSAANLPLSFYGLGGRGSGSATSRRPRGAWIGVFTYSIPLHTRSAQIPHVGGAQRSVRGHLASWYELQAVGAFALWHCLLAWRGVWGSARLCVAWASTSPRGRGQGAQGGHLTPRCALPSHVMSYLGEISWRVSDLQLPQDRRGGAPVCAPAQILGPSFCMENWTRASLLRTTLLTFSTHQKLLNHVGQGAPGRCAGARGDTG